LSEWLCCLSKVPVVKPAQHWLRPNGPNLGRLDLPCLRTVLLLPEMNPAPVVVVQVLAKDAPEALLIEDDHMIQAFTPDRPDHPFDV